MMRRRIVWLLTLVSAGTFAITACATHTAPPSVPDPSPDLYINEALPAEARLCVMRNPWNDATAICMTIGDFRALLRHRVDVVAHGVGR